MDYEILSDVSLDLDREFMNSNDVKFVAMEYMLGEDAFNCVEPESDEMMHNYYEKLRAKVPTRTSQITPFLYVDAFEPYVKEGKSLMYICLSSGLSNTYESALLAVKELEDKYENVCIEVIDSYGATGGMGLMVESAVKNRNDGMSLKENATWMRAHAKRVNYYFKVEDLMYLSRGGRLSTASAVIGTALNIRPILTINGSGRLDVVAKKRGDKLAESYLLEKFEEDFDASVSDVVYISCADCLEKADRVKEKILEKHPKLKVRTTMLSPIIGAHTGPDMLAVIYYGKMR